jgi:hypothetical protein
MHLPDVSDPESYEMRRGNRTFLLRKGRGFGLILVLSLSLTATAQPPVSTTFERPVRNANYPELVYWFVAPETFAPGRVAQDIHHIADDTFFTFPFLTERKGVLLLKHSKADGNGAGRGKAGMR